ncbi:hypothetical protein ACSVH2_05140 [Flavobacterium sp. RSB2_4_14]|uniref:hypothetical protein n=1 Tax=Flavobacterium sp. RSB2_4_14 TaxID=3447665 RepID=UPI003F2B7A55
MGIIPILTLIILFIPVYIQFKFGIKSASGWLKVNHFVFTLLVFISEYIIAFVLFWILMYLDKDSGMRCGPGWVMMCVFSIPFSILILIIGLLQKIFLKNNS